MYFLTKKFVRKIFNHIYRNLEGTITSVITEEPIASLTFDDGPDPNYTKKVLCILKKHNAFATFFMVGEGVQCYPDVVLDVAKDGHAIGNHSWDHFAFPLVTSMERLRQIRKCQRVIYPYGRRLFRPPYGMINKKARIEILLQGYKIIGWSFSPEDWCEPNVEVMTDSLMNNIRPGSIILLHDRLFDEGKPKKGSIHNVEAVIDREPMLLALNNVLEQLSGHIHFVTIPTLLNRGKPLFEKY